MATTAGDSQTETETDRTSELSELSKPPSEYTLDVTILRFRAVAIPVAMAAFFVGVTLPFAGNGMQVGSFSSIDLDEAERKELLDKYNERLGSLTALMMKPLDVTLSMVVAVIFLMLASKMSAYLESRRRYLLIGVIGVVGYLMNTGFNSMNLQVVPARGDLVVESVHDNTQQLDAEGNLTTTWDTKFRESTPGNSVLNTILRGLFIPREEVPTHCKETDDWYYATAFKNVLPSYGFPSRTWQQNALSKALEPTASMSMPMNAAESDLEQYDGLPMSERIATNLVVYSLVVSNTFLGWWKKEDEAWGSFSHANATGKVVLADYFNLTARSNGNASFASTARQVIFDYYDKAELSRTSDASAKAEFTRVNLTETIVFDALTIELSYMYIFYIYTGTDSDEYEAAHTLLLAHAEMVALFRSLQDQDVVQSSARIGLVLSGFGIPYDDTNDADVEAAERYNQFNSGWFLAPLTTGDYPPMMRERVGSRLPNFTDEEAALVKGSYDLIMINHYYSNLITYCDSEHSATNCSSLAEGYYADMGVDHSQVHPESVIGSGSLANPTSCTDHSGFPPSYMAYIRWANAYDTSADMLLTENGWCGNETIDNQDQLWYYRTHLEMVHRAIYEENIPIIGYTAWSFVDNYEWGSYAPRYGLYYVDFPDNIGDKDVYSVPSTYLNRTARTAAKWYANLATTGCFESEPEDEKWLAYL